MYVYDDYWTVICVYLGVYMTITGRLCVCILGVYMKVTGRLS